MRNTNKKGFTIVELVIVVAVIAILAAVLIPTFSGVIAKAKLSADKKAVQEMNTYIAMEEADSFEKALAALEKNKVNTKNLTPISAEYSFVWNSETNKIELVETKADTKDILESVKEVDVTVNTADYFVFAVNNGSKSIKLGADITVDRDIIFEGENITLDLGGKKLTTTVIKNAGNPEKEEHAYIRVNAGASVTITNGTFEGRGVMVNKDGKLTVKDGTVINALDVNGGGCIRVKAGANVVIEGGTFNVPNRIAWDDVNKGGAAAVYNQGGTITIKGGTFNSNTTAYLIGNESGTITIDGGTFTAYRGALSATGGEVVVNGGTFEVTNDEQGGRVAYAVGGSIVLNGGSFSHVNADHDYWYVGNVTGDAKK